MAVCKFCGKDFDLGDVRRSVGRRYGAGVYNDYYPEGDVCEDCAVEEISCDYATGLEIKDLMGSSWDDD